VKVRVISFASRLFPPSCEGPAIIPGGIRIGGGTRLAFVVAALFAVHPLASDIVVP